jgi:hypothetical protein
MAVQFLAQRANGGPQHLQCVVIASLAPDFQRQPPLCQESAEVENKYFQ